MEEDTIEVRPEERNALKEMSEDETEPNLFRASALAIVGFSHLGNDEDQKAEPNVFGKRWIC